MLIKICGMTRKEDLQMAAKNGADFCGFVFAQTSPRYVQPEMAAMLPSFGMKRVGIFVAQDADAISKVMDIARLDYAQLHGHQADSVARDIGPEKIIRVLWPQKYENLFELEAEARGLSAPAFFLLDSGKAGGGSGISLSWEKLLDLDLPAPWFLAGGLNEKNCMNAAKMARPHGLDFNSGLEDVPGRKNSQKLIAALQIAKQL